MVHVREVRMIVHMSLAMWKHAFRTPIRVCEKGQQRGPRKRAETVERAIGDGTIDRETPHCGPSPALRGGGGGSAPVEMKGASG